MKTAPDNRSPRRLLRLVRWIGSTARLLWEFAGMWLATRSVRSFLVGLPAGVLLVGLPIVAALGLAEPAPRSLDEYQLLARGAYARHDFDAAELWTRKIVNAQPENDAARFLLALSLQGQGEVRRAHTHIRRLAPQGETGYGPAHLWMAETLLNAQDRSAEQLRAAIDHLSAAERFAQHSTPGEANARAREAQRDARMALARLLADSPTPSAEMLNEARFHLEAILDEHRDHVDANFVMARVLRKLGADRQAIPHLQRIADERPDVRTQLAGIYLKHGDVGSAQAEFAAARDRFRQQLDGRPDDIDVRLRLANAHAQLGEYGAAANVLREAMPAVDEEGAPQLRKAWSSLCVAAIAVELKRSHPDWERILRVIDVGLRVGDDDPRLYEAIGVVIGRNQDQETEHARLRTVLEDALAAGRAPATCHLLLGSALGAAGEVEQGIQHLRTALKEYPDHPVVANNLAMLLLRTSTPQPEEALHFADLAVAAAPALATVRDTRGQALFALGRYNEALPELEKAIAVEADRALRHGMLAEIYQRRGDVRMADKHRELAKAHGGE